MSNVETINNNDQWADRELTEAQRKNRGAAELIPFGEHGVSPENFAQVVDFAKMMSSARGAVPAHLVGNTGACLAVIELAQKFQMSPYMLAMGCFSVNGMLAFTGQTIAAIMNKHMPLEETPDGKKTRLKYRFEGEVIYEMVDNVDERTGVVTGKVRKNVSTLRVIVTGRMKGESEELEYKSPMLKDLKNRNSPLWEEDPEQQFIYFGSKRWQRRWWPEGMLGIYDPEELRDRNIGADNAKLIEASDNPGKALVERIAAAKVQTDNADRVTEGFTKDHAHNETDPNQRKSADDFVFEKQTGEVIESPATENAVAAASDGGPGQVADQPATASADPEPEHEIMPQNMTEWKAYALAWIDKLGHDPKVTAEDMYARWKAETKLRNDCGLTTEVRDEVYDAFTALRDEKPKVEKTPAKKKTK